MNWLAVVNLLVHATGNKTESKEEPLRDVTNYNFGWKNS